MARKKTLNAAPAAPPRLGPRPLPLYLGLAHMLWLSLPPAWPILKSGLMLSPAAALPPHGLPLDLQSLLLPGVREKLRSLLSDLQARTTRDPAAEDAFFEALAQHCASQYQSFLEGVTLYRMSSFCRDMPEAPCLWQKGCVRLLDYTHKTEGQRSTADRQVVFVIPSLINRFHILDLDLTQSFMYSLSARGFVPLLLDWGVPGEEERGFDISLYIEKRLLPALRFAHKWSGGPAHVAGYCMGGLFAVAAAQLAPGDVQSLLCLASPWDFHAGDAGLTARVQATHAALKAMIEQWDEMPVDVLQSYFVSLSPFSLLDKYVRFASLRQNSAEARAFVLLEDWVNDGVPLVKGVAQDCLQKWYIENAPARGAWAVMGKAIAPHTLSLPSLHVIPERDKIVPPASARALAERMRGAETVMPACGHVSMMAHAAARDNVWPRIFDWLASKAVHH